TRRPRETGTAAVTPPTASSPSGRDVTPGAPEHDAWSRVGADLLARWGERGRLYHDTQHLTETLDAVDALAAAEGLDGAAHRRASLAAWFHDAVHRSGLSRGAAAPQDGRVASGAPSAASEGAASEAGEPGEPDSDEAASAALARRTLTALGDPDADEVARLVLLTATHQVEASDAVGAVLCDADLAVLGAAPARYADYAAAIRGEYADVPDGEFRAGRSAILTALLSGPLYATGAGSRWWEHPARANVAAEVAALE
ncbi:HD domain-containing protein, partial [Miniimonas arenae]|uniref:HD domain-containing protein n=1 Tax=Miniimonas arenae TaxID=676201 RepID=UPI00406BC45D